MRRDYDIFEKFSDGSTLWRACVTGRFEALRKIQDLAERSENNFFIMGIEGGDLLRPLMARADSRSLVKNGTTG